MSSHSQEAVWWTVFHRVVNFVINCKSQYLGASDRPFEFWEDFVSSDQWND